MKLHALKVGAHNSASELFDSRPCFHVMNDIAQKNRMQIGYHNREKILRIFKLIDQVSQRVYTDQKRMVCIKFILKQLLDILGTEYKSIPLTKSKKTLNYYNLWWKHVYRLIKDDINRP